MFTTRYVGMLFVTVRLLARCVSGFQLELGLIRRPREARTLRTSVVCRLNRFLFSHSELSRGQHSPLEVLLPKDDYRTLHAAKTLNLHNGDTIRAGLISCDDHDGLMTDNAVIEWIPEGKVKKAEPLGNGDPPGSLRIRLESLEPPQESLAPSVSIILALPRPLQLGRMLPMIAQMGVDHLILTTAQKVPKEYFGSHLFKTPGLLTERLVEGLCQAGDVRLPKVRIVRNLSNFLNNQLEELFPSDTHARVIAHPERFQVTGQKRMRQISFPLTDARRIVVAVGPEGGWEEPEELNLFVKGYGFQQISMGQRVLRSDCAVISLLSLAHDTCSDS
jgi:RsmE family RNA methyltransferase